MDRKAWIVLITCGILLAVNMHYAGKNAEATRILEESKKQEEAAAQKSAAEPIGELTVKPEPVPEQIGSEESHSLVTKTNDFVLSSLEGGIKWSEFLEEKAVHGDGNVLMNDLGLNRIGALTTISGSPLDNAFYKRTPESTDDNLTYLGTTSNGLIVQKNWQKVSEGPGNDYRLKLTLTLANNTQAAINLGDIALATGSSAPVFADERSNYLTFFWHADGKYDSETESYFKGGFFGKDRSEFREFMGEGLEFSGVENQFFATIVTPEKPYPATVRVFPKTVTLPASRSPETEEKKVFNSYLSLPAESLAPGKDLEITYDIFIGPKNNSLIRSLDGDKGDVMDYGLFGWISRPLNWTLNKLSNLFGGEGNSWSFGWAIVALTLIIRTIMWPLHAKSTRTMKRMSKLQPKIKALKEKYPDDPNKMNQEMMKLYREFGVNPMGGCVPMLFQIPVFFGFYNMLQYAVELRNQPFLGWVKDLSQPDTITEIAGLPLNILPILMAVTMVIQMAITPKTGDKMQQRIFMLMPLIFFFFCYNFASALALYWTTQNIFSIAQTWIMQKMPEPELKTSKNAGKKSMMQKLAERAEEAQKLRQAGGVKGGKSAKPGQAPQKPKKPRGPKTGG
ncbi:membrane protein insertase YidC [Verrucomicrobiaceae bacterium 227]